MSPASVIWAGAERYLFHQAAIATEPGSILLQGRSGTGKTVTILQRMLHRQQRALAGGIPVPRQLFVTRSSFLRDEVGKELSARQGKVYDVLLVIILGPF